MRWVPLLLTAACYSSPAPIDLNDSFSDALEREDIFPLAAVAHEDETYTAWLTQVPVPGSLGVYLLSHDSIFVGLREDWPASWCPRAPCFRWTYDNIQVRIDVADILVPEDGADLVAVYDSYGP